MFRPYIFPPAFGSSIPSLFRSRGEELVKAPDLAARRVRETNILTISDVLPSKPRILKAVAHQVETIYINYNLELRRSS